MKRPTRFYSNRQEKNVAKTIGGKQVANSGATRFSKGDVRDAEWLFECKTGVSEKKSFSIKHDWLKKNKEEAFAMDKRYNALVFDYGDYGERYYVVDERTFLKMKEALEEFENGTGISN